MGGSCAKQIEENKKKISQKIDKLRYFQGVFEAQAADEVRKQQEKSLSDQKRFKLAIERIRAFLQPYQKITHVIMAGYDVKQFGETFLQVIEKQFKDLPNQHAELADTASEVADLVESVKALREVQNKPWHRNEYRNEHHGLVGNLDKRYDLVLDRVKQLEGERRGSRHLGYALQGFGIGLMIAGVFTIAASLFMPLLIPLSIAVWIAVGGVLGAVAGNYMRRDGERLEKENAMQGLPLNLCLFGDALVDHVKYRRFSEPGLRVEISRGLR